MHRINLIIVLLGIATSIIAQADSTAYKSAPIQIIGKHKGSEVLLRWAYSTPNDWLTYKMTRHDLYRRDIAKDSEFQLVKKDIGVVSEAELEDLFVAGGESVGMGAVYDAYYGDWQTSDKKGDYGQFDKKDELESKYLILHYACDIDFAAAEAAGIGYRDANVEPNTNYMYRLVPTAGEYSGRHKSVTKEDTAAPLVISEWAENEGQVTLAWSRLRYEEEYTGYYIEKSLDGSSYAQVNEQPYVHLETEDVPNMPNIIWQEAVQNYEPAYYRIRGIDAFGELSSPSNSVKLMGRDRTPATLPYLEGAKLNDEQTQVEVKWSYQADVPADLDYYILQKTYGSGSATYKDVAKIDASETSYEDAEVSVAQAVFYKLCAVDTAKNYSCTDPVYTIIDDKIAPAAPQSLAGSVDTNGVVTLNWDLGQEPDLLGYYVHVSNGTGRVFVPVTDKPLQADHWHGTIPIDVLTEEIYYRVVAVDLRYNTSDFSEIIQLKKPDIVPPNPSVFKGYKINDGSVVLEYALSNSRDAVAFTLIKESEASTMEIALESNSASYTDVDVSPRQKYTYTIITEDDAGLQARSPQSLTIRTKDDKQGHKLTLSYKQVDGKVSLSWSDPVAEVDYVKLYRGPDQRSLVSYKTSKSDIQLEVNTAEVTDQYLRAKIFYKDGAKSAFSNVVQVQ